MSSEDEKAPAVSEESPVIEAPAEAPGAEEVPETLSPVPSPIKSPTVEMEDDDDESVGYEESAERDEIIRERINRTQESMRLIVENLSEDQLKRYERFRRVTFSRNIMEKFMQRVLEQKVNTNCVIVINGIAKVFVGELIEGARQVMEEEIRAQLELALLDADSLEEAVLTAMSSRPLEPFHLYESHRRMKEELFSAPKSAYFAKTSPFS